MTKPTHKLPPQILEQATTWFIELREGEADPSTHDEFNQWLRRSPEHVRAYLEISNIWEDAEALKSPPNLDLLIANARTESNIRPLGVERVPDTCISGLSGLSPELAETERELQAVPAVTIAASQSMFGRYATAIAAILVMVAGIGAWLYQRNLYTTDIAEQRTIALEDGSVIQLNAQSKIRVAYTDDTRNIQLLRGQALFKVAKDPSRPFIVNTDGTTVRAVGTQFDIYKKTTGTQITVVEGRVAVAPRVPGSGFSGVPGLSPAGRWADDETTAATPSDPRPTATDGATDGPRDSGGGDTLHTAGSASSQHAATSHLTANAGELLLSAGEQILIAQADRPPELPIGSSEPSAGTVPVTTKTPTPAPIKANVDAATAWTQQKLVFQDTPLREVVNEFNRYNHKPLVIHDPNLYDYHISGTFPSTDPTRIIEFLRQRFGVLINDTGDEIEIRPQA